MSLLISTLARKILKPTHVVHTSINTKNINVTIWGFFFDSIYWHDRYQQNMYLNVPVNGIDI